MNACFLLLMFGIIFLSGAVQVLGEPWARGYGYPACQSTPLNRTSADCPIIISMAQTVQVTFTLGAILWVPVGLALPPTHKSRFIFKGGR